MVLPELSPAVSRTMAQSTELFYFFLFIARKQLHWNHVVPEQPKEE